MLAGLLMGRFATLLLAALTLLASQASAQDLRSKDPVTWRLAALEAAHQGEKALPQLEALADQAPDRVRIALSAMLLEHESALGTVNEKYPALLKLAKPFLEEGQKAASQLEGASSFWTGGRGLTAPGASKPSKTELALNRLKDLGGFAMLAIQELAASRTPETRLYAGALIVRLRAPAGAETLKRLAQDPAKVRIFGGDWTSQTTVGKYAANALRLPPVGGGNPVAIEAERYLGRLDWPTRVVLILNGLRKRAETGKATSWADYWKRARPHLPKLILERQLVPKGLLGKWRFSKADPPGAPEINLTYTFFPERYRLDGDPRITEQGRAELKSRTGARYELRLFERVKGNPRWGKGIAETVWTVDLAKDGKAFTCVRPWPGRRFTRELKR